MIFAIVVIYFGKETGTTGGEIRHTEIRANNNEVPIKENHNQSEEDDDYKTTANRRSCCTTSF